MPLFIECVAVATGVAVVDGVAEILWHAGVLWQPPQSTSWQMGEDGIPSWVVPPQPPSWQVPAD